MREKFEFNKYNTDLDKKLRKIHGTDSYQKLVRVVIAVVIIVITAIIITIIVKNKAQEVKKDIDKEISSFDADRFKQDLTNNVNDVAGDIKNSISDGIQNLLSK